MAHESRNGTAWSDVLLLGVALLGAAALALGGCEGSGNTGTRPAASGDERATLADAATASAAESPTAASATVAPHAGVPAGPPAPAGAGDRPTPERGRYVIAVGGCNDCHTPGFMEKGWAVPETEWLTGVPVGWKGPWGTTYASNLRLFLKDFDEDTFVQVARSRNSRPPMPWPNLHAMSDTDLRSVFRYIRSLPLKGEPMPAYVPPGQEPSTVYVEMSPQTPKLRADAR